MTIVWVYDIDDNNSLSLWQWWWQYLLWWYCIMLVMMTIVRVYDIGVWKVDRQRVAHQPTQPTTLPSNYIGNKGDHDGLLIMTMMVVINTGECSHLSTTNVNSWSNLKEDLSLSPNGLLYLTICPPLPNSLCCSSMVAALNRSYLVLLFVLSIRMSQVWQSWQFSDSKYRREQNLLT